MSRNLKCDSESKRLVDLLTDRVGLPRQCVGLEQLFAQLVQTLTKVELALAGQVHVRVVAAERGACGRATATAAAATLSSGSSGQMPVGRVLVLQLLNGELERHAVLVD